MHSLPLYTSCLFFILLKEDIVDTEKPDAICLLTFVVDEIFTFISLFYDTFKIWINNKMVFYQIFDTE